MNPEPQVQANQDESSVRVRVLTQKITQWISEHPDALVAADKARLVVNISGTSIRVHVEQIYERL